MNQTNIIYHQLDWIDSIHLRSKQVKKLTKQTKNIYIKKKTLRNNSIPTDKKLYNENVCTYLRIFNIYFRQQSKRSLDGSSSPLV